MSPMIINKITPSVYSIWLYRRLETSSYELTNYNLRKVTKVIEPTNKMPVFENFGCQYNLQYYVPCILGHNYNQVIVVN